VRKPERMHPLGRAAGAQPHVRSLFDQHPGYAAHRPDFGFRENGQIASSERIGAGNRGTISNADRSWRKFGSWYCLHGPLRFAAKHSSVLPDQDSFPDKHGCPDERANTAFLLPDPVGRRDRSSRSCGRSCKLTRTRLKNSSSQARSLWVGRQRALASETRARRARL
jgi:hypothetical protein